MIEVQITVPDGSSEEEALGRCTHLCVGAHQDDLEIMAFPAIVQCYASLEQHFVGVVVTDGAGSPRTGKFSEVRNEDMVAFRSSEQREAAALGRYSAVIEVGLSSDTLKSADGQAALISWLSEFLLPATRPEVLYTHNPADKHMSHLAVTEAVVRALQAQPSFELPAVMLGCEVWRGLDWVPDRFKTLIPCPADHPLEQDLLRCFPSQIEGGKRYDMGEPGRRRANALYHASHEVDGCEAGIYALDLSEWVRQPNWTRADFLRPILSRFEEELGASPFS